MADLLRLLALTPSAESADFVADKGQFHLHTLLTEQRHPRTWDLSFVAARDAEAALRAIHSVDDDLERVAERLAADPAVVERMAGAVATAVAAGRRVYVYGCGATGRLSKQMESTFWRPFWRRLLAGPLGARLAGALPAGIEEALVGEMTGADRALVSSLEGFEDLPRLGALQLRDHGIGRGDVVICVTEGGETSSVIGTVLAALEQYAPLDDAARAAARERLFFVYNNPAEVLRPFERSRRVLDEPGITRLELASGPQAITGSTRMQATTIETWVIGAVLEEAVLRLLRPHLGAGELAALGLPGDPGVAGRLRGLRAVRAAVARALPALARLTEREAATYTAGGQATYFARAALITVFIDCAERSPTFRLFPLDRADAAERRSWVQVWTEADGGAAAWRALLGRPFRGLDPARYREPLAAVEDPYLRRAALQSLDHAGDDQAAGYDFAFAAANVERRGPRAGDLGVCVAVGAEDGDRAAARFAGLFGSDRLALVRAGGAAEAAEWSAPAAGAPCVDVVLDDTGDPLGLRRQLALKILLNAHSTATMARLGRVVGNTMTNVSPSNLKLVGRATFLIRSWVDDVLAQPEWRARGIEPVTFAQANAVLFDAIRWVREQGVGETGEVALCIVRIVESLSRGAAIGWHEARAVLQADGLPAFLHRHLPALGSGTRNS